MSDPNPNIPDHQRGQPPRDPERKSSSPLLWIVLLLALLAFGWFIYNQRAGVSDVPEPLPPPAADMGDARDAAAERERAADDARRESRERPAQPRATAAPDSEPELTNRVQPEYPATAYRERAEGTVLVGILVNANGRPVEVEVVRRSGNRELDRAAVDAVRQWTFQPAMRDGKKVEARVEVPVTFRLDAQ
ncbi:MULTISPECIES: energy transducer TonB [unclassified Luteimonas]